MSRQTAARVRKQNGDELVVQDNHSDAPLLPIGNIERLHAIRPDRVDWVFEQTEKEAEDRRREQSRVNTFIFIERLGAQIFSAAIGICGIGGGIYAGLHGQPWLGGTIATVTIGTLAVAHLNKQPPAK